MKRLSKSVVLLLALTPLALFSADKPATNSAAPAKPAEGAAVPKDKLDALFGNTIVAKGQGVSVTRAQLDEALIGLKSRAAAAGQAIPPQQLVMLEQQILQRLIQVQLLSSRATDADKAEGKEQVDKRMVEIKAKAGSDENLDRQLKSVGLTRAELISKMTDEAVAEAVLKREVKAGVKDEDVKKYYDEHPAKFEQPELVRAAHILLSTKEADEANPNPATQKDLPDDKKQAKRKQLEDILKRARGGEDFAKLAKEFSEDPGSKETGGEYTFPRGQMVPEFENAAFALNTNQISDVITTSFGYHIIKLYDKIPAKTAALDDEVAFPGRYMVIKKYWKGPPEAVQGATKLSTLIHDKLESDQMQELAPEYLKKLQADAKVEILDDRLKPEPEPAGMQMPMPAPVTPKPADKPAGGK